MVERRLTVWWCDECGYARLERSTGVQQTCSARDPQGRMVVHELRPVTFVAEQDPQRLPEDMTQGG